MCGLLWLASTWQNDSWKAFVTWSCYPVIWSFWWDNHSALPWSFSSPGHFPSHLAAFRARVAPELHDSCHCRHSRLCSNLYVIFQVLSPDIGSAYSSGLLLPSRLVHLAFYPFSSDLLLWITHVGLDHPVVKHWPDPHGASVWGLRVGLRELIQILFSSAVYWPVNNMGRSFLQQNIGSWLPQVAESISMDTLLTSVLGWVRYPTSPLGSYTSLYHCTYFVFFAFSCLSPIHIPLPIWETRQQEACLIRLSNLSM